MRDTTQPSSRRGAFTNAGKEASPPKGTTRGAPFGRLTARRRLATVAALAGLTGGIVGAGVVSVFDGKPSSLSTSSRTSPDVAALLADVLPGVVSIQTSVKAGRQGSATGMVISADGEVLTNAHVVTGAASIRVTRYGTNRALSARLVGICPEDDLALVRIQGQEGLPTVTLGTSADLPIGAFVVAVGNALGLSAGTPTITQGIISAEGRSITTDQGNRAVRLENLLETDAAINPGNSGGPLFDSDGRVIGVNTAVADGAQGLGFAVPVDQAKDLLSELRAGGTKGPSVAFLGIEGVSLTPAIAEAYGLLPTTGVVVSRVVAGSPAEVAGLLPGDVVVAIAGTPITDATRLDQLIARSDVGQSLQFQVVRGADTTTFSVTLASEPQRQVKGQ
jgi:S1-C subfamily serine protease